MTTIGTYQYSKQVIFSPVSPGHVPAFSARLHVFGTGWGLKGTGRTGWAGSDGQGKGRGGTKYKYYFIIS